MLPVHLPQGKKGYVSIDLDRCWSSRVVNTHGYRQTQLRNHGFFQTDKGTIMDAGVHYEVKEKKDPARKWDYNQDKEQRTPTGTETLQTALKDVSQHISALTTRGVNMSLSPRGMRGAKKRKPGEKVEICTGQVMKSLSEIGVTTAGQETLRAECRAHFLPQYGDLSTLRHRLRDHFSKVAHGRRARGELTSDAFKKLFKLTQSELEEESRKRKRTGMRKARDVGTDEDEEEEKEYIGKVGGDPEDEDEESAAPDEDDASGYGEGDGEGDNDDDSDDEDYDDDGGEF